MNKHLSTLILTIVSITFLNAQSVVGVKSSIGFIPLRPETVYASNNSDYVTNKITVSKASPIMSGGLYFKKTMGWTYFQVDAMYSAYNLTYDFENYGNREINKSSEVEKFKNIDLVVNAGITSDNLRLGFGPVFHILADHNSAFSSVPNYVEKLSSVTYGFSGAVGYDFGNLSVDLRYENALTTIGDHVYWGAARSKFETGANQVTLSVGYGF